MSSNNSTLEADRQERIARATPCDFDGCNGVRHEYGTDQSEWSHTVVAEEFDGGIIDVTITGTATGFTGDIYFGGNGDMTSDDFRQAATQYEAFPAWLRGHADRLDALNAA